MTQQTARRYLKCDKCDERAYMADWRPAPGLDPDLCEFACIRCGHSFYQRIPLEERWDYKK